MNSTKSTVFKWIFLLAMGIIFILGGQDMSIDAAERTGIVGGQVVDMYGRPVGQYPVMIEGVGEFADKKYTAITDFTGAFQVLCVAPGKYEVYPLNLQSEKKVIQVTGEKTDWDKIILKAMQKFSVDLNPEAANNINPEAAKTINPAAAKTINPEAAKTINAEAAKTINPGAAKTINAEAAKTINPEAAKVLDAGRAKILRPEDASRLTPAEAKQPL